MNDLITTLRTAMRQSVSVYEKGLKTRQSSWVANGDAWRMEGVVQDPWTRQQIQTSPLRCFINAKGHIEVEDAKGERLVWESPTRLIQIAVSGLRTIHVSKHPILVLAADFLVVSQIVLSEYGALAADEPISISSFETGGLVTYLFAVEGVALGLGESDEPIRRRAGTRPATSKNYAALVQSAPFDLLLSADGDLLGWISPPDDVVTVIDRATVATSLRLWQGAGVSQPDFSTVTLTHQQMIATRDGVKLANTILMPSEGAHRPLPGPFPVILMRTPYGRNESVRDAFKFVARGYVVVAQDVRGRGDSEGCFMPLQNDIGDGNDTLDWIAAQPWCDGNIGMIGGSYLGWVQWQAACSGNPHLKALISIVPSFSAFGDLPYVNGIFCAGSLTWAIRMGGSAELLAEALGKDLNAIVNQLPLIDADIRATGQIIPLWRHWVSHSSLDGFWQPGNILNFQENIDLPVLHITGWYDDMIRGTMAAYGMMKNNCRENQKLLIGPWPHVINSTRQLATLDFGDASCRDDLHFKYVSWFDRWLKGHKSADNGALVEYFTMGENKWHRTNNWPPASTAPQKWYLSSGSSNADAMGGQLTLNRPPEGQGPDHFVHDPCDPVPYLVDIRTNQLSVPEDYQEVERRSDVLMYTTDFFETPLEITGNATAVIYAATNQPDTDWVVRVTDVFPDGRSINVIDGYLRARFRNGMEREVEVTPGEVIEYHIQMTWTSYRFAEGHKMRLMIASAAAGAFVVNTNTGNDVATDTDVRSAHQTIHHSQKFPSHIEVSVMPHP